MNRDKIELSILVDGTPIKEHGNKGDTYVKAVEGVNYSLRIRNHYGHRVLVVPSIDGLNPLNGKETVNNDEGYVVPAYGSVTIDGWRTSLSEVAKFVFDKKAQSYSAVVGKETANCGVIGIQVFSEKVYEPQVIHHWYHHDYYWPYYGGNRDWNRRNYDYATLTSSPNTNYTYTSLLLKEQEMSNMVFESKSSGSNQMYACSLGSGDMTTRGVENINYCAPTTEEPYQVGTGWGAPKESVVGQVTFAKDILLQTLEIYYSNKAGLESLGIDLSKSASVAFTKPQAFSNFCQPPTNINQ